VTLTFQDHVRS